MWDLVSFGIVAVFLVLFFAKVRSANQERELRSPVILVVNTGLGLVAVAGGYLWASPEYGPLAAAVAAIGAFLLTWVALSIVWGLLG